MMPLGRVRAFFPTFTRRFATNTEIKRSRINRFKFTKTKIAIGTFAAGGIVYYNTSDTGHEILRHIFLTTRRIGVVTLATARCFYQYKKTLKRNYESEDEKNTALSNCHKYCALVTLHALQSNGGVFIKLGQHIGAMTYLLPQEWTETMIPLQDHCPESTMEEIEDLFRQDLKISIEDKFAEFDPKPIGVASLAQVHTARLKENGQKVAVKCQHPSLKEFVPLDVMMTQTVFNLMDIVFPEYPLTWLGDELQSSIFVELDFTKEARNSIDTQRYFSQYKKETALRIPDVISANKRILIMEFISGRRLDDLAYLDENHISRAEVSACLSHIFNNMIFTPNVGLHCDPHGGNLAIRAVPKHSYLSSNPHNFEIILFDHGLYRFPTTQTRRDYAKFWLALLDHDQAKVKIYAKRFANITDDQFPLFVAAITGRSIEAALNYDISKPRSNDEIKDMAMGMVKGTLFSDLMNILSRIPRIVLLILKTNDLTRNLDECLQNPLGPERSFLIMTQYCARTVYGEAREAINNQYKRWSLCWIWQEIKAWLVYESRKNQLLFYDMALWWKKKFD